MSDPAAPRIESEHGNVVVHLSGDIDFSNTETLETEISRAVLGADSIVIDLEAIEFLDSSGLRLLKRLSAHATEADASFVVVAPPNSVARSVIEIVSLSQELAVQDSLQPPNRP
jgi:anti-sigma B factor antagonist